MDLNSPEFYTMAFVLAMALVALLMGKREKGPCSTHILQLATTLDGDADDDDVVSLQRVDNGRVLIRRTGFSLAPEETVNLVFTIHDDECLIVEKKGVKRRKAVGVPARGEVTVKFLRPVKYRVRYESQLTSAWASFTFDPSSTTLKQVTLKF